MHSGVIINGLIDKKRYARLTFANLTEAVVQGFYSYTIEMLLPWMNYSAATHRCGVK